MSEPHWRMTQSLRVATFSHLNKLGEDVLVETDLKTKLCRHGETSSTIRNWLQFEAKARTECQTPPPRISTCDCTHTLGLQNSTLTRLPAPPSCVYDMLASGDAKQLGVGEAEPALQLGDREAYLSSTGTIYCGHKAKLIPHAKRGLRPYVFKAEGRRCQCYLHLPRRTPKLGLGRCAS